jgi:hypothetical protein
MYPHRIRLRGPWTAEPLFAYTLDGRRTTEHLPTPFRMTMPGRVPNFRGGVRFVRPFGYPGRIDQNERVWLTFDAIAGHATVTLNGHALGTTTGQAEFEVTPLLAPRNQLVVEVDDPESPGLPGEVALEIRATAFLRGVTFETAGGQLTARGLVVGEAPRPLELYLFGGGHFLAYAQTPASATGQPFTLTGGVESASPILTRVELVDTATIWYVVQQTLAAQTKPSAGSS